MLQCYNVTMSQCYNVTMSQCHNVTMLKCHNVTMLHCHSHNVFCKYKDNCKTFHEKNLCENLNCEVKKCALRHPKKGKCLGDCGYCKFGEWVYPFDMTSNV